MDGQNILMQAIATKEARDKFMEANNYVDYDDYGDYGNYVDTYGDYNDYLDGTGDQDDSDTEKE